MVLAVSEAGFRLRLGDALRSDSIVSAVPSSQLRPSLRLRSTDSKS